MPKMRKFKNLTGKKYNRCVVLGFAGYKGPFAAWLCRCKCGNQFVRTGASLERGGRTGCGCFRNPSPVPQRIRAIYWKIIARCYDPQHASYHLYGKRGIRVCKRWRGSVELFVKDMGKRPSPKHYVVRKNRRKHFTPANCHWGRNRDTSHGRSRLITHRGNTLSLNAWAKELGITQNAMRLRANKCLANGWDVAWAVAVPIRPRAPMAAPLR